MDRRYKALESLRKQHSEGRPGNFQFVNIKGLYRHGDLWVPQEAQENPSGAPRQLRIEQPLFGVEVVAIIVVRHIRRDPVIDAGNVPALVYERAQTVNLRVDGLFSGNECPLVHSAQ